MKNSRLITLFFIVALIGTAAAVPALPAEFYGTATLNGAPVPAGTVIVARINDTDRGSIAVGQEGCFGGQGTFAERLYVTATEEDLTDTDAPAISFWIGSTKADQEVNFSSGGVMEIGLTFCAQPVDPGGPPGDPTPTPADPTPSPAGPSTGTGGGGSGTGGSQFVFDPKATPTPTPTPGAPQPTVTEETPGPAVTAVGAAPTAAKPWFSLPIPLAPWTALAAFAVLLLFRRR